MATKRKQKRPAKLASASAYYRLAAKADRAGQGKQAEHWRGVADRLVSSHRRDREAAEQRNRRG
jgi:hypothetical protein